MASSAFLILEEGNEEQLRRVCVYLWPNFKVLTYPVDFLFLKHMEFIGWRGESNHISPGINSYL